MEIDLKKSLHREVVSYLAIALFLLFFFLGPWAFTGCGRSVVSDSKYDETKNELEAIKRAEESKKMKEAAEKEAKALYATKIQELEKAKVALEAEKEKLAKERIKEESVKIAQATFDKKEESLKKTIQDQQTKLVELEKKDALNQVRQEMEKEFRKIIEELKFQNEELLKKLKKLEFTPQKEKKDSLSFESSHFDSNSAFKERWWQNYLQGLQRNSYKWVTYGGVHYRVAAPLPSEVIAAEKKRFDTQLMELASKLK